MKKALLFLFAIAMLLSLCACRTPQQPEQPDKGEDIQLPEQNMPEENASEENGLTESLILSLTEYLQNLYAEYEMPEKSFANKIGEIKTLHSSLHVKFDSSKYYYACAYYPSTHEHETKMYCCAADYTWVRFNDERDIQEYDNDALFVVAFQINMQSFARNISSNITTNQKIEHYQIYKPIFKDGFNIAPSIVFDSSFIYLNKKPEDHVIYHTMDANDHDWLTIPCIELEDQYYLIFPLYTEYTDGYRSEVNLVQEFGEYYDDLLNIMVRDRHNMCDEKGRTTYYGLFSIDDFANDILK